METTPVSNTTVLPKKDISTQLGAQLVPEKNVEGLPDIKQEENQWKAEMSIANAMSQLKLLASQKLKTTDILNIITDLITTDTLSELNNEARSYLSSLEYKPIESINGNTTTYKNPVKFNLEPETLPIIADLVLEAALDKNIAPQVIERVLFKPQVLTKLAVVYEHGFMLGANSPDEKEQLIRKLIKQYANDDAALRFIKKVIPTISLNENTKINAYEAVINDPVLYSKIVLTHRWICKKYGVDPNDVDKQLINKNGVNPIAKELTNIITQTGPVKSLQLLIANLRQDAPIPYDKNLTIGESLFFKPLIDTQTVSPIQFLLDCFERGIKNVEFAADLLPFDPIKRLPGEYTDKEIERIRELGKTLGLTFTVHSPIVGPLHPKIKFVSVLEDAADNVQIIKDTIDFANKLGARNVVVHISDRNSEDAIKQYAEIATHAIGKWSLDGKPLKIGFENYMNKALPDGTRPFPTIEEHFEPFSKIVKQVAKTAIEQNQNPTEALQHCALLLDSAHFNLVTNFEDPLRAVAVLPELAYKLGKELLSDSQLGSKLKETGFDIERFVKGLVTELHLNQNIGPIGFTVPNKDYNADIHNPVESIGSIDNIGFVSLIQDFGFGDVDGSGSNDGLVILAEQKKPLSPGGLQILYNAAKQAPNINIPKGVECIKYFVERGIEAINKFKAVNEGEFNRLKSLLETDKEGEVHNYYAYVAGRLGIDHLIEHLNRRAFHRVLCAQANSISLKDLTSLPLEDIALKTYESGELIIKKGVTLDEAREKGNNKFYLTAKGSVIIQPGDNVKDFELKAGVPFGEAMFLSGEPRSANVIAGSNGATLVEISENDFWSMYKLLAPFQERLDTHYEKRFGITR